MKPNNKEKGMQGKELPAPPASPKYARKIGIIISVSIADLGEELTISLDGKSSEGSKDKQRRKPIAWRMKR
jgi:hypothetical protein